MFCPKCGAQIPDGSVFCQNCGASLGSAQTNYLPNGGYPPQYANNRQSEIESLRKNMRGERAWYIVGGVLLSIIAVIYLLIGILGVTQTSSYYGDERTGLLVGVGMFVFMSLLLLAFAIVDFVYASKLKKNSMEPNEAVFLEKCTSPAPIIMGIFFNYIALIYAIIIFCKARKIQ